MYGADSFLVRSARMTDTELACATVFAADGPRKLHIHVATRLINVLVRERATHLVEYLGFDEFELEQKDTEATTRFLVFREKVQECRETEVPAI